LDASAAPPVPFVPQTLRESIPQTVPQTVPDASVFPRA